MATEPTPRGGEVWLVASGPSIGRETQKARPAVVISNDTANALLNRVQVVPISSQVARRYPDGIGAASESQPFGGSISQPAKAP